jgi:hypothetical protein
MYDDCVQHFRKAAVNQDPHMHIVSYSTEGIPLLYVKPRILDTQYCRFSSS